MACPPDQSIRSSDARSPDSHRTNLDTERQPRQSCRQIIGTTTPSNATSRGQRAADPSRFHSQQLQHGAVLLLAGGTAVAGCQARIRPKRVSQRRWASRDSAGGPGSGDSSVPPPTSLPPRPGRGAVKLPTGEGGNSFSTSRSNNMSRGTPLANCGRAGGGGAT